MEIKNKRLIKPIHIYLSIYFLVNLFFLTQFPKMHSDESWLSGLSRSMMAGGFSSTEYFFDLLPRSPHAIKIIFHSFQIVFINIFGYSLMSVRLLSLVISILCLYVFYKLAMIVFEKNVKASVLMTIILSIDIQYLYASHLARQEIAILFFIIVTIYYIVKTQVWKKKNDIILGVIIGLSIGFHPNSFIIAGMAGAIYLYKIIIERKFRVSNLARLIVMVGIFAVIFIGLSLLFNINFYQDYTEYGKTVGVDRTILQRITYIFEFYKMLFLKDSVTYYMPPIAGQLIVFMVGAITSTILIIIKKAKPNFIIFFIAFLTVSIGYIVIGRYSQPTIIFIFPIMYLLIGMILCRFTKVNSKMLYVLFSVILIFNIVNTGIELKQEVNNDYKKYIEDIKYKIPEDVIVLGNLNIEYALQADKFYDYRNLAYLESGQFENYITDRDIKYIVYPEEMDYIYKRRPVWNIVYGNMYLYYDDMQEFLQQSCELVFEGESDYAMRILNLSDNKEWTYKIYRVNEENYD